MKFIFKGRANTTGLMCSQIQKKDVPLQPLYLISIYQLDIPYKISFPHNQRILSTPQKAPLNAPMRVPLELIKPCSLQKQSYKFILSFTTKRHHKTKYKE